MASLLHPTVRLDLRRRFDCASLRVHAERRAIPFFSFLFQGGVYQSPETNLPPQHVSIIIILPIYTTALVHNKHICLSVRPVCLSGERENFIRIPQPKPVSANSTPCKSSNHQHLLRGSWVSDKVSCLPRHAFYSVSDARRPDYQTPLIMQACCWRVLLWTIACSFRR